MTSLNEIDTEDLEAFLVESQEILSQFEQDVLALEKNVTDPDRVNRLYRGLHTLKGNCGFLPFPKLEAIAHAGESLLESIRTAQRDFTPDVATALLQLIDTVRQLLTTIEATLTEGDRDYSGLLATLTALCTSTATSATVESISTVNDEPDLQNSAMLDSTIRVQVELLDQVMNLVGELVIARNQVLQLTTHSDPLLISTCGQIDFITNELQDSVMRARMQPISTLWRNVPRLVRDVALSCGKEVTLTLEGSETELDRNIVSALKDPLTHLIRNCVDHGIEAPEVRIAQGKLAQGSLKLKALQESGKVMLEITDDGAGIDADRLKAKAQQLGLISGAQAESFSDREAYELIFLPGFSTTTEVTYVSGRGVGMDVVRRNLESVSGTIEVESRLEQGTTFRLKIPLTLAIIPTLLVCAGGERFAIPQTNVRELVRIEGKAEIEQKIETLLNVPVYRLREQLLPLVNLAGVLELADAPSDVLYFVAIESDGYRFGLIVDRIEDTQDIVVKPLSKQLKSLEMFAGTTVLGNGDAALILDATGLAAYAGVRQQSQLVATVDRIEDREEQHLILIVLGAENSRMGIVLDRETRLETIEVERIERVGTQYLVQYRDRIVSLIDLQTFFTKTPRALAEFEEVIPIVVVMLEDGRSVGLMVERILDIVEESLTVTGVAGRPGVRCYATIQGQITEILDLDAIVALANPHHTSRELALGLAR
jgi:two-component system, chemotaxis family, sensor kinase CheA